MNEKRSPGFFVSLATCSYSLFFVGIPRPRTPNLTDYSRFKADCERILMEYSSEDFTTVTIRPATVCGYSPRQRLDVVVNILTNLAYHKREISVFGGEQLRPNIHIADMVNAYMVLLKAPKEKIDGKIFNAGYENRSVKELAKTIKAVVGDDVKLITTPP